MAYRDCDHCTEWYYDEKTGVLKIHRGEPVKRFTPPPCRFGEGRCPKGTPEAQRSLSDRNWQAYTHYLKCKAVGRFPEDEIVERNAAIIRMVEDTIEAERSERLAAAFGLKR